MDGSTGFDELVEQQDQELAQNGTVWPFTCQPLETSAEGQPVLPIHLDSPEIPQGTVNAFQAVQRLPVSEDDFEDDEDDWDSWWNEG